MYCELLRSIVLRYFPLSIHDDIMFRVPHGPWTILVVGVWGRFYSGVYGREMSQGWDEGDGVQG